MPLFLDNSATVSPDDNTSISVSLDGDTFFRQSCLYLSRQLYHCSSDVATLTVGMPALARANSAPPSVGDTSLFSVRSLYEYLISKKLSWTVQLTHASFVSMAKAFKGKFEATNSEIKAYLDMFPVKLGDAPYPATVRTSSCSLVIMSGRCESCKSYRPILRAKYSRWLKKTSSPCKYTNNRYLTTPQRQKKMKTLQYRAYSAEREVVRLKERINRSTDSKGIVVDDSLNDDLSKIMEESNSSINEHFPEGSFRRLFWEQQLQAARARNMKQMRWHPCMIQWCLNLKLLSSSAYHSLHTSGFIKLPSERTLCDYTHFIQSKTGFYTELDKYLIDEASNWKHFIVIALEIKGKESLVYDKFETKIIGFVDVGDISNYLARLEQECCVNSQIFPVATHMFVIMVKGIFTSLEFIYSHFPTNNLTGEQLCHILWEAIERLEHLGFKVLVVADGASVNRKMFQLHRSQSSEYSPYTPLYKMANLYTNEKRDIYFMSVVPRLIKTTRNNWHQSTASGSRKLWVSVLFA